LNRLSEEDENYENIKEIKEDNIEAANRQLRSKKDDCNGYRAQEIENSAKTP
jgi:hypothetical protein